MNSINYADAVAYDKNGYNYISNFNYGDSDKKYVEHWCMTREEANDYCLK